MFTKPEKKEPRIETLIGQGTELEGNILTNESVRIDGKVKGEIRAESVIIGDTGVILGDISANKVTLNGKVKGNISANQLLEILPNGQLLGDIRTSKLIISDGALFEGSCQMVRSDGQIIELSTTEVALEAELPGKKNVKVIGDGTRH